MIFTPQIAGQCLEVGPVAVVHRLLDHMAQRVPDTRPQVLQGSLSDRGDGSGWGGGGEVLGEERDRRADIVRVVQIGNQLHRQTPSSS